MVWYQFSSVRLPDRIGEVPLFSSVHSVQFMNSSGPDCRLGTLRYASLKEYWYLGQSTDNISQTGKKHVIVDMSSEIGGLRRNLGAASGVTPCAEFRRTTRRRKFWRKGTIQKFQRKTRIYPEFQMFFLGFFILTRAPNTSFHTYAAQ